MQNIEQNTRTITYYHKIIIIVVELVNIMLKLTVYIIREINHHPHYNNNIL